MAYEMLLLSDKATLVLDRIGGRKNPESLQAIGLIQVILDHGLVEAQVKSAKSGSQGMPRISTPADRSIELYDPVQALGLQRRCG